MKLANAKGKKTGEDQDKKRQKEVEAEAKAALSAKSSYYSGRFFMLVSPPSHREFQKSVKQLKNCLGVVSPVK